jgi:hypothetical protein
LSLEGKSHKQRVEKSTSPPLMGGQLEKLNHISNAQGVKTVPVLLGCTAQPGSTVTAAAPRSPTKKATPILFPCSAKKVAIKKANTALRDWAFAG